MLAKLSPSQLPYVVARALLGIAALGIAALGIAAVGI